MNQQSQQNQQQVPANLDTLAIELNKGIAGMAEAYRVLFGAAQNEIKARDEKIAERDEKIAKLESELGESKKAKMESKDIASPEQ